MLTPIVSIGISALENGILGCVYRLFLCTSLEKINDTITSLNRRPPTAKADISFPDKRQPASFKFIYAKQFETKYYLRKSYEYTTCEQTSEILDRLDRELALKVPIAFLLTPANRLVRPHKMTHAPMYIEGLRKSIRMRLTGIQKDNSRETWKHG